MGLDAREELKRKGVQKRLENMTGEKFVALAASGGVSTAPNGYSAFLNRFKSLVKTSKVDDAPRDNLLMGVMTRKFKKLPISTQLYLIVL